MHWLCTCLHILVTIWEKILIILDFLFFILVVLVKTACTRPRATNTFLFKFIFLFFKFCFCVYSVSFRKVVLGKRGVWSASQYNSVYFKVVILLSAGRKISVMIVVDADITLRRAHLHSNICKYAYICCTQYCWFLETDV